MDQTTHYATTADGVHVAYQTVGDGPTDLLFVTGFVFHVEEAWEWPHTARFLRRLAGFARVIIFDRRGTGMSDRIMRDPSQLTLEARMDDLRAVMDAAGSARATLFTFEEGLALGVVFAATYPERTRALISYAGIPTSRIHPDYPWGWTDEQWDEAFDAMRRGWGRALAPEWAAESWPDVHDPIFVEAYARYMRRAVSPGDAVELLRIDSETDVRDLLPLVPVPTLVLHRVGDVASPIEEGRYVAAAIPGAELVELPGTEHGWNGPDQDVLIDEIGGYLSRLRHEDTALTRVLATVMFTDIVASTTAVAEIGDAAWHQRLAGHRATLRRLLDRFGGREVVTTGDGFLAVFDGPARAIGCARVALATAAADFVALRVGIHTGEVLPAGSDITGIAVHIAARVAAAAAPSEVLVTRTVTDLVAGSGIRFHDRGTHTLLGIPGEWHLHAVDTSAP